jgi:hypothetical protein
MVYMVYIDKYIVTFNPIFESENNHATERRYNKDIQEQLNYQSFWTLRQIAAQSINGEQITRRIRSDR